MKLIGCEGASCGEPPASTCECVWVCARGRTRLCCQMRPQGEGGVELEVLRNSRVYGTYRFGERMSALAFAARLRFTFEGNGWMAA